MNKFLALTTIIALAFSLSAMSGTKKKKKRSHKRPTQSKVQDKSATSGKKKAKTKAIHKDDESED